MLAEEAFNILGKGSRVLLFLFDDNKELTLCSGVKEEKRKIFVMRTGGLFER